MVKIKKQKTGESLGDKLKRLLKMLIFKNAILQRLDEMADDITQMAESNEATRESMERLVESVENMVGRLRNTDGIEDTQKEVDKLFNDYMDSLNKENRLIDTTTNMPDIMSTIKDVVDFKGSKEEFERFFNENAKFYNNGNLIPKNGKVEGQTSLLIKLNEKYYEATLDVSAPKAHDSNAPDKKKRDLVFSLKKFEGDVSKATEVIDNVSRTRYGAMMHSFLAPKSLRQTDDVKSFRDDFEQFKDNRYVRELNFYNERADKIHVSPDGRFESIYHSASNTFSVRDRTTKEMVHFRSKNGIIRMDVYSNTNDIDDRDKNKRSKNEFGDWICDTSKGTIKYNIQLAGQMQLDLFRSPDVVEFLNSKNAPIAKLIKTVDAQAKEGVPKKGYYSINKSAIPTINIVKKALEDTAYKSGKPYFIREIQNFRKNSDKGQVYLVATNEKGYSMSFSFNEKGEPATITFKDKPDSKFTFVYDFKLNNFGNGYEKYKKDEQFVEMYSVFRDAQQLFVERERASRGVPTPTPVPERFVPNINNVKSEFDIFKDKVKDPELFDSHSQGHNSRENEYKCCVHYLYNEMNRFEKGENVRMAEVLNRMPHSFVKKTLVNSIEKIANEGKDVTDNSRVDLRKYINSPNLLKKEMGKWLENYSSNFTSDNTFSAASNKFEAYLMESKNSSYTSEYRAKKMQNYYEEKHSYEDVKNRPLDQNRNTPFYPDI